MGIFGKASSKEVTAAGLRQELVRAPKMALMERGLSP
jgi:hypothetical protein